MSMSGIKYAANYLLNIHRNISQEWKQDLYYEDFVLKNATKRYYTRIPKKDNLREKGFQLAVLMKRLPFFGDEDTWAFSASYHVNTHDAICGNGWRELDLPEMLLRTNYDEQAAIIKTAVEADLLLLKVVFENEKVKLSNLISEYIKEPTNAPERILFEFSKDNDFIVRRFQTDTDCFNAAKVLDTPQKQKLLHEFFHMAAARDYFHTYVAIKHENIVIKQEAPETHKRVKQEALETHKRVKQEAPEKPRTHKKPKQEGV
jgi:hypothetical protein